MLTIRVMVPGTIVVYTVEEAQDGEIDLRLCLYCGLKLVQPPRKFCCDSHKARYCEKKISLAQQ